MRQSDIISVSVEYALRTFNQGGLSVPAWHRTSDVWDQRRRSRFIETVLLDLPVPPIWLIGSMVAGELVDGLQRLTALNMFLNGSLKLKLLKELPEYNGKTFHNLPSELRSKYLSHPVAYYMMKGKTPSGVDTAQRMYGLLHAV